MSRLRGSLGVLAIAAAVAAALASSAPAQENIVVDANIFWDNDGGSYASDSGGASCPHGSITNTQLATSIFDNQTIDPQLSDPYNINAPDWSPLGTSPAIGGNVNARIVKVWDLDPWFSEVCYTGAASTGDRWWDGWTYFNYNNGAGRTDIPAGTPIDVFTISSNTTWTNGNKYRLNGRVDVQAGATLTIEPGVVVLGSGVGSYLVVERNADLIVNGTRQNPVIFTSGAAPGNQFPGDWGGIVIHGNAVANCADVDGCGLTSVAGDCESEGGAGFFGGSNDADDSGSIRFARVEYAGQEISPNNELNAWTFNAVGTGTEVNYLQAHLGTDDNFEWFGGTVKTKFLVSTGGDDDNIDWQMGYRGRIQFAVCQQAGSAITPNADAGIEADNNENDSDCEGRSNPILSNLTLIGTGSNPGGARGIRLRRGTAGVVVNSIVAGFSNVGLRVESSALDNCAGTSPTDATCPTVVCDSLMVDANIFYDNDGGSYATDSGGASCWHGSINNTDLATTIFDNQTLDPDLADPYNLSTPDWSPNSGSPTLPFNGNHRAVRVRDLDPWFDEVCFTGAADFGDRWWQGWTYFNYNNGAGRTDIPAVAPIDVFTVSSDTTWTTGTKIRLNGRVDVQAGFTLTVEPGVVVIGSGIGSYLVVERNADLIVNGTQAQPVIFTSGASPGNQFPGDWGGVVIHGNAVANCADVDGCGLTSVAGDCESEGGAGFFGGADDADDSGSLRYARVEYAGQEISPNNELNAWTFNAVGTGTEVEYLQAHLGTDDNFEWFGGTVKTKYLVSTGGDDDNIDWQMGYRGRIQFAVCQQAGSAVTPNADAGIEADNNENDSDCEGRSCPILANLTLIGTGNNPGGARGIRLRRGTAGVVVNSVVQGFSNVGLRVESSSLDVCASQVTLDDINCGAVAGVDDRVLPAVFTTFAAPNPMVNATSINFSTDLGGRAVVQVFDVTGRLVDVIQDGYLSAGDHSVHWDGASTASGTYFYSVVTPSGKATGKLVVVK